MGMPHAADRWTAEMVRALPNDGNRYELVSGQLLVTPAPAPRHQAAAAALYDRLAPFLRGEITSLMLAIEILSPGTERHDRTVKRRRYQRPSRLIGLHIW
jgi:Uma2 family endonuclease